MGGRILKSELVALEDGKRAIKQRIMATKPWAIENILDGTINRFSIGWFAQRQVLLQLQCGFPLQGLQAYAERAGQGGQGRESDSAPHGGLRGQGSIGGCHARLRPGTGVEGLLQAKEKVVGTSGVKVASEEKKEDEKMNHRFSPL